MVYQDLTEDPSNLPLPPATEPPLVDPSDARDYSEYDDNPELRTD